MDLDLPVCVTCGVQYEADVDRAHCAICEDDRQYVGWDGQRWTSLRELAAQGVRAVVREEEPGLWGVGSEPEFAIGQRALLVPGDGGTVLWDCVTPIDDDAVAAVRARGGIAAIALSHPHYYSSIVEWSRAFGDVPIWVHADDERWLGRRANVRLWRGERVEVLPGRTMLDLRVHFPGGSVLHWPGLDGRGAVCSGDILQVVPDRRWVSFMYSYPNLVPEHPDVIARALALLQPYDFDRVYGAWWGRVVHADAKAAVTRSAHRYFAHIDAATDALPPSPR